MSDHVWFFIFAVIIVALQPAIVYIDCWRDNRKLDREEKEHAEQQFLRKLEQ